MSTFYRGKFCPRINLFRDGAMRSELYWIDGPWNGRLAMLPRPRGGDWLEDEVREWQMAGINTMVTLLTNDEVADLDLAEEARLCRASGIDLVSFPIVDRSVPASRTAVIDLLQELASVLERGQSVAIHCRQGIGRSALIAICLLIVSGIAPDIAIARVSAARGCAVPETAEQRQWVVEFAQNLVPSSTRGRLGGLKR